MSGSSPVGTDTQAVRAINRPGTRDRAIARKGFDPEVEALPGHTSMHRVLGPRSLTALGLSGIVGAGIFVSIGVTAHDKTGPAIILSLAIAAVACVAVALCYCECASAVPSAGSPYAYGYAAVGELGAWLAGWNLATCHLLAGAAVSQAWSGYFQSLLGALGISWPRLLGGAPIDLNPATGQFEATGSVLNLPALLILAAITAVVYRGIKLSLRINSVVLAVKLAVLAIVIVVGLAHFNPSNWSPFAPYGYGGLTIASIFGQRGAAATGVLAGAATVFFAFGGFEVLSAYSEECRSPRRDVPTGVIATICLVTLPYMGVAAAIISVVPYDKISLSAPVSDAFRQAGMPWIHLLVGVGAVAGMTTVLLVVVMGLPRVLMAIGRDGLLPERFFNTIHPVYRTPWKGVLLVDAVARCL